MEGVMVHSLQALRSNSELLLTMMDVFIKEPSLDWKVTIITHMLFILLPAGVDVPFNTNLINAYLVDLYLLLIVLVVFTRVYVYI